MLVPGLILLRSPIHFVRPLMLRMTRTQLAKRAGVSRSSVSRFLGGKTKTGKTRRKILRVLKISSTKERAFFRKLRLETRRNARLREKPREVVIKYLKANPMATSGDLRRAGLEKAFAAGFGRSIKNARRAAGLPYEKNRSRDFRKARLLQYLKTHPEATVSQITRDGYYQDLYTGYKGLLSEARIDAGLRADEPVARRKERVADPRKRQALLTWLRRNPTATLEAVRIAGFGSQLRYFFSGLISNARKAAGVTGTHPGYVSAAKAGRMLGLTRESARTLFYAGALQGFRQGRFIYVTKTSVAQRKLLMKQRKMKSATQKSRR